MKTLNKTVVAWAAGTVGAVMVAGSVSATPETTVTAYDLSAREESRHVSYADLNLNTEAGMATLQSRIERAAREVCGRKIYRRTDGLAQSRRNAQCQEEAIAAALSQIRSNEVAARN